MKKYALILVAVVLVMSASAFVLANQSNSQPPATYWFLMDASGTQVTTTQSSDVDLDCSNKDIEPDCARQYLESQTEIIGGVRHVKASEVNNFIDYRSKE